MSRETMEDPAMIRDHLALAEKYVALGEHHLATQHRVRATLRQGGHDVRSALEPLKQFEDMQALHIADRDRLRLELAKAE